MKITACLILILSSFTMFGQTSWTQKYSVKTTFKLGESHIYEVNELFKLDNIFYRIRSEIKSTVIFEVVDTANGGEWIRYNVFTNSVKQKRDSSAILIAKLMDGIQLYIYAKNGFLQLDSTSYYKTKNRVSKALDSITVNEPTTKKNQYIAFIKSELEKPSGLGSLLTPLLIFESYYFSKEYKKYLLTETGESTDIFHNVSFYGGIEKQWKTTTQDSIVKLNFKFIGDPTQAASYYKAYYKKLLEAQNIKKGKNFYPDFMRYISDYRFQSKFNCAFPILLSRKSVSEYLFRTVSKVTMKELDLVLR